ncbi:MAG: hypothetical protein H0Z40_07455 [Desulfotomaculum sp.]|nr:hypothetical protein [Desulfotomaculum sp.]
MHSLEKNAQNIHFTAYFTHHLNKDGSLEGQAPDGGLLVNKYNLAGIAIWRLGFADDVFWEKIEIQDLVLNALLKQ